MSKKSSDPSHEKPNDKDDKSQELTCKLAKIRMQRQKSVHDGEYQHKGVSFLGMFPLDVLQRIPRYDYKDGDILMACYPKSGLRWVQEIVYALVNKGNVKAAVDKDLNDRVPFMELSLGKLWPAGLGVLDTMPSPRLMKTNLMGGYFDKAMEKGVKTIILIRNPKDTITAYYYYYQLMPMYNNGNDGFSGFFENFQDKRLAHGDYFDWIQSWYEQYDNPNVHFVKFEELKADPKKEISRIADHIGIEASDDLLDRVAEYASFRNLKQMRMDKYKTEKQGVGLLRRGVVGDWRRVFNKEQSDIVDDIMSEKLKDCRVSYAPSTLK